MSVKDPFLLSLCLSVCHLLTQKRLNGCNKYCYLGLGLGPWMVLGLKNPDSVPGSPEKQKKTVLVLIVTAQPLPTPYSGVATRG